MAATAATQRNWYIVRTNIRSEDKAAKSLRSSGYRVYLPKMRMSILHHRTKKWMVRHFVLFNRYLFVGVLPNDRNEEDFLTLRGCDGVESILGIQGRPFRVARSQVAQFIAYQRQRKFDNTRPSDEAASRMRKEDTKRRYRPGRSVHVVRGPFGGFSGHVSAVTGKGAVRTMLCIFERLTPVEFEADDLELADPEAA